MDVIELELLGHGFTLISAWPLFKFNPSVSFLVACRTYSEVEELWRRLAEGGTPLMELGEYPFSPKYGWIQDKYGLSWQIVSTVMEEMLRDSDEKTKSRVTQAFLKMKKLDIARLKAAYEGERQ